MRVSTLERTHSIPVLKGAPACVGTRVSPSAPSLVLGRPGTAGTAVRSTLADCSPLIRSRPRQGRAGTAGAR